MNQQPAIECPGEGCKGLSMLGIAWEIEAWQILWKQVFYIRANVCAYNFVVPPLASATHICSYLLTYAYMHLCT